MNKFSLSLGLLLNVLLLFPNEDAFKNNRWFCVKSQSVVLGTAAPEKERMENFFSIYFSAHPNTFTMTRPEVFGATSGSWMVKGDVLILKYKNNNISSKVWKIEYVSNDNFLILRDLTAGITYYMVRGKG